MDILTEVLASMRTSRPAAVRTNGRAPWALRLPPVAGAGFHVVLHGSCWLLEPDASRPPLHLREGDVVFLRDGHGHVLADDPATEPTEPGEEALAVSERRAVAARAESGLDGAAAPGPEPASDGPSATGEGPAPDGPGVARFRDGSPIGTVSLGGGGAEARLLCGAYHLDQGRPHPLVRQLPEVVHLATGGGRHPELTAAIGLLRSELDGPRLGSDGIVPALVDSLLLYVLRAWLDGQPSDALAGWAAALRDPVIAPALAAIHRAPDRPWTVEGLAARAGTSRATFARRFTSLVGEPPLAYLTRWRMTTAVDLLKDPALPLAAVAARTGYGSEYAFGKAFKREFGQPPGGYRRQLGPVAGATGLVG
ncbi:AraC family transcriptional regulator [Kitasatospora sp. MMS16-BH015]|uniref:AraC family transcriptional regulator n=1 Tax=Kitasatospora sp. MMS16-BH015 TaxID=2018025 RepID=UPI000CA19643|nr:AraC family transcriptional regulator [Kitasatospora sp. MMS16-BH015]AUG79775.1 AraC family transcriptional regulator [Kitasatospora sp. MMS16-BH015]